MRLACVEIRKAYLCKESSETMQIERRGGALCVHLVLREVEEGRGGQGGRPGRGERRKVHRAATD